MDAARIKGSSIGRGALLFLFFSSGITGMGYQLVWARWLGMGLGHDIPAVLATVVSFFFGMALGCFFLEGRWQRRRTAGWWYIALELGIAIFGILSLWGIPWINQMAPRLLGLSPTPFWHGLVTFFLPASILFPLPAALGASVPTMMRFYASVFPSEGSASRVYVANTFGAVAGVVIAPFYLLPQLGFPKSVVALVGVNLFCALGSWAFLRRARSPNNLAADPAEPRSGNRLIAAQLFLAGLLGLGFEMVAVRTLSQVLENTVFSFSSTLAVVLGGSAGGAWLAQKGKQRQSLRWWSTLTAFTVLWSLFAHRAKTVYDPIREQFGDGVMAVFGAELLTTALFVLPATITMGGLFSALLERALQQKLPHGKALGWNLLGATGGPILANVLFLPWIGIRPLMLGLACGYLLVQGKFRSIRVAVVVGWAIAAWISFGLSAPEKTPGRILSQKEGLMATVSVVEDQDGHRSLRVNNRFQMGGTRARVAEQRQGYIPLLLHEKPQRALFLGLGTGLTASAGRAFPELEVDAVELLPEIFKAAPFFDPNPGDPALQRYHFYVADARRFVRTTTNRYDVIVSDVFHPSMDGAGALYTREHFAAIRRRLNDDGVFFQWLPLHQLDHSTLNLITRSFVDVFANAEAWMLHYNVDIPVVALVGRLSDQPVGLAQLESRLREAGLAESLRTVGLTHPLHLTGLFVAGPAELRTMSARAKLNTDAHPRVIFEAPRFTEAQRRSTHGRLFTLMQLGERSVAPVNFDGGHHTANDLRNYISARNRYLQGLVEEEQKNLRAAIDAYLESSGRSLFFVPAYARMVSVITVMQKTDPAGARQLFERLESVRPDQPLGRRVLKF